MKLIDVLVLSSNNGSSLIENMDAQAVPVVDSEVNKSKSGQPKKPSSKEKHKQGLDKGGLPSSSQ